MGNRTQPNDWKSNRLPAQNIISSMLGTDYGHALLGQHTERRNSCEQSSLGQALGGQLAQTNTTNSPVYSPETYHLTPASPQSIQASSSRAESRFPSAATSPTLKRKHAGEFINTTTPLKRKRDTEEGSEYEDGTTQGSKHWTDDEKSRLFNWLMAVGQDEHWQSLRAAKNSCLRECASNVYEGRKTYQALKGCYERNFNLFKQLYALEMYNEQTGHSRVAATTFPDEEERQKEYDRRLQRARDAGIDVKGVSARILDHWQNRTNWYDLFYSRWHGDPATTRPTTHRTGNALIHGTNEPDGEDDLAQYEQNQNLNLAHSQPIHPTMSHSLEQSLQFIHHEPHREQRPSISEAAHISTRPSDSLSSHTTHPAATFLPTLSHIHSHTPVPNSHAGLSPTVDSTTDPGSHPENPALALPLTQAMYTHIIQYMQSQNHYRQMKLEYLRRRQEREETESLERRNLERARHELEISEMEQRRQTEYIKQRQEWAYQAVNNPLIDPGVKQAATEFLKSLFS